MAIVWFVPKVSLERTELYLPIQAAYGTVTSMYKHEISIASLNCAMPQIKPLSPFNLSSDYCLPSLGVPIKPRFQFLHFCTRHFGVTPNGLILASLPT